MYIILIQINLHHKSNLNFFFSFILSLQVCMKIQNLNHFIISIWGIWSWTTQTRTQHTQLKFICLQFEPCGCGTTERLEWFQPTEFQLVICMVFLFYALICDMVKKEYANDPFYTNRYVFLSGTYSHTRPKVVRKNPSKVQKEPTNVTQL